VRTEYNTGRTVKYKIYTHSNKELILLNLQHNFTLHYPATNYRPTRVEPC